MEFNRFVTELWDKLTNREIRSIQPVPPSDQRQYQRSANRLKGIAAYSAFCLLFSSSATASSSSESPPSSWARATATRGEMFTYKLATFRIPLARSSTVGLLGFRRFLPDLRTSWSYFRFRVSNVSWASAPLPLEGRWVGELGEGMVGGYKMRVKGTSVPADEAFISLLRRLSSHCREVCSSSFSQSRIYKHGWERWIWELEIPGIKTG